MEKKRLKVLTYNIHKGFSSGNLRYTLKTIREAIRNVHADLVFLQEVLGHHEEHKNKVVDWPTASQFEFLADELWPHFAYGKNAVYTAGHHGNAILSKYPFKFWENQDISTNRLERRGLLHGIIEVPHKRKPIHVICVHLGLMEVERREQVRLVCKRIHEMVPDDEPLIIGGDFNDWRQRVTPALSKSLKLREVFMELNGEHPKTFPSWLPALRLDRLYFRGMHPEHARCLTEQPWSTLSDHAALYAELVV